MAKVIGPWTPNYSVDFRSNGDTTRAAFGKHIQEIERIYGLLSGLGAAKIEAEDLTAAMTANKNEWTTAIAAEKSARESAIAAEKSARESAIAAEATVRSNGDIALGRRIDGLTFGNIGGTLGLDRTTGDLPFGRIVGNLDTSRINGLENFIKSKSSGISDWNVSTDGSGYMRFGEGGLIIQWGRQTKESRVENKGHVSFPIIFPVTCFVVVSSIWADDNESSEGKNYGGSYNVHGINDWTTSGFACFTSWEAITPGFTWIAIGD